MKFLPFALSIGLLYTCLSSVYALSSYDHTAPARSALQTTAEHAQSDPPCSSYLECSPPTIELEDTLSKKIYCVSFDWQILPKATPSWGYWTSKDSLGLPSISFTSDTIYTIQLTVSNFCGTETHTTSFSIQSNDRIVYGLKQNSWQLFNPKGTGRGPMEFADYVIAGPALNLGFDEANNVATVTVSLPENCRITNTSDLSVQDGVILLDDHTIVFEFTLQLPPVSCQMQVMDNGEVNMEASMGFWVSWLLIGIGLRRLPRMRNGLVALIYGIPPKRVRTLLAEDRLEDALLLLERRARKKRYSHQRNLVTQLKGRLVNLQTGNLVGTLNLADQDVVRNRLRNAILMLV